MGIVDHFNKAISMTSAEYICILGADNRLLSNYVEECRRILDISDTTAIAYNDCALFGPRAELAYQQYGDSLRGQVIDNTIYLTNFPEFNETTAQQLNNYNFIHGSSMYRRTAYDAVGGYKSSQEKPEDHGLFLRMVNAGWRACKATKTYLEYRQHSADQANTALNSYYELLFYKRKSHQLERELRDWRTNPLRAFGKYLILPKVLTIYRIIRKDGIRGFIRKLTEYQWRETSQSRTRS